MSDQPLVFGMLRIKNEARWIERVIRSIQPICQQIHVFDDHSTDGTAEICESLGAVVYRSEFDALDERRDKNFLLTRIYESLPPDPPVFAGNPNSPFWALCIDGDEELEPEGIDLIRRAITESVANAFSLRIKYLWDSDRQYRVDGVYANFRRPSLFRMINGSFTFQSTPWGGNLHCSSIPQEMIAGFAPCEAGLLHYGYIDRELRMRKYRWYTSVDPNNPSEDNYRHIVQGDLPEIPAGMRLMHAGPLTLETR